MTPWNDPPDAEQIAVVDDRERAEERQAIEDEFLFGTEFDR